MKNRSCVILGKILLAIIAAPFILFLLLAFLLYLPPVQNWAVDMAARYASESTGKEIRIGEVALCFPLDIQLDDVLVLEKNNTAGNDTILSVERAICNLNISSLLDGRIGVDILQLDAVDINTSDYISDCHVNGKVGKALVVCRAIDLQNDSIIIDKIRFNDAILDVNLSDTAQQDTASSVIPWKIILSDCNITNTELALHLPGDTINVTAGIGGMSLSGGAFNLQNGIYSVDALNIQKSRIKYDLSGLSSSMQRSGGSQPALQNSGVDGMDADTQRDSRTFDYNHLSINDLNLGIKSLLYSQNVFNMSVVACNFKEDSGLTLSSLTGDMNMSDGYFAVRNISLATPHSRISGAASFDMDVLARDSSGRIEAEVQCSVGRDDIILLSSGALPDGIVSMLPQKPAEFSVDLSGNLSHLYVNHLDFDIPTFFRGNVTGEVKDVLDMERVSASMKLDVTEHQGNGNISGTLCYMPGMRYESKLSVDKFNCQRFMPDVALGSLSAQMEIKGQGADLFSPATNIEAGINVSELEYAGNDFSGSDIECRLAGGRLYANINSTSKSILGDVVFDGLLDKSRVSATIGMNLSNLDLYSLNITDSPLAIGACGHIDIESDFTHNHSIYGHVSNLSITDSLNVYHPDDIELNLLALNDTTDIVMSCGDFLLKASAKENYESLLNVSDVLAEEIDRQWTERTINESLLREKLPHAKIYLKTGHENPMARFLSHVGYAFSSANADLKTSPNTGINGVVSIDTLKTKDFQLDNISANINSDTLKTSYEICVANGPENPQYSFTALAKGEVVNDGTSCTLTLDDNNGERGFDIGISAFVESEHIRMAFHNRPQILGYKAFSPNKDNFIRIGKGMRLSSDVMLIADDGVGLRLYTNDENVDALQDLTLSVYNLDIASILSVVPYMPRITGVMNGDFHAIVDEESMSISADVNTEKLCYEESLIGNISSEIVYMPHSDGSHYLDGIIRKDDNEIATISGKYIFGEEDYIDAQLILTKMPADIINGFIPDKLIGMRGYGNGELNVKGDVSNPKINGVLNLEQAAFISVPYGIEMKIADDAVRIEDSKVVFDNFQFYDSASHPLTMNGSLDFSDTEHIWTDLRIGGKNILIIDAKENKYSEAYGKAYVNLSSYIRGELSRLDVKAKLDVLPTTNLYYILRDSPLTTDNRLKELVTFVDFNDSIPAPQARPSVDGINVDLTIDMQAGAHVTCWLNANHSNYLDIIGNGDLRLQYSQEKMLLTGRYTISSGEMKYSLPIIPLKTFAISEGSYIDFTGDMMNPRLNITATENVRSSVSDSNGQRVVGFNCGVKISKTLQDMGLEFLISAPEDKPINDELSTMSIEERGKLAVTMLTTGIYLNNNSSSNITMNSALSTFLQQEINNIAGSALRTLDLSVGLESNTLADGTMSMDYSFKFAKRFWNNRVSVSIGGKISSKPQSSGRSNSFFDNVEMQYRLSDTSNQYLRLFYKHDVYDYLEGYLDQYGAGYVWKRKLQNLNELWNLKGEESKERDGKPEENKTLEK